MFVRNSFVVLVRNIAKMVSHHTAKGLESLSLDELISEATILGITNPKGHKRHKKTWMDAILSHVDNSPGRPKAGKKRKIEEVATSLPSNCPYLAATRHAKRAAEIISSPGNSSLLGRLSSGVKGLLGFSENGEQSSLPVVDQGGEDRSSSVATDDEEVSAGEAGSSASCSEDSSSSSSCGQGNNPSQRGSQDEMKGDVSKCPFFNNKLSKLKPALSNVTDLDCSARYHSVAIMTIY
jgi:hypothetical protein